MPENSKSTKNSIKMIILGYFSIILIIIGLIIYYINFWMLYLTVIGELLYLISSIQLSKKKIDPRVNFHLKRISTINGGAFIFLFIIPYFLGYLR